MWISSKSRSKEGLCKFDKKIKWIFTFQARCRKFLMQKNHWKAWRDNSWNDNLWSDSSSNDSSSKDSSPNDSSSNDSSSNDSSSHDSLSNWQVIEPTVYRTTVYQTRVYRKKVIERQFIEPTVFDFDQTKYGTFKCKHTMERFLLVEWILPSEYAGFSNAHFNHIHEQRKGWGAVLELWAMETYKKQ